MDGESETMKNLGTMTIKDIFVTDYDFNLINIDFTKIEQIEEVIKKQAREIKVNDEDEGSIQNEEIESEDEEQSKVDKKGDCPKIKWGDY